MNATSDLFCAVRLAHRELRGGVRGFRVFLACVVLGVGAIAAIGSLGAAVQAGIAADATSLLGGDVSARLALRPASADERRFLAAAGTLSEVTKLRAMARSGDGARHSLIELQAVGAAYPLYGAVALRPGIRIFGVEPEAANDTWLSFRAGHRVEIPLPITSADGLMAASPGAITFPIIQRLVEDILLVSEDEIRQTVKFALTRMKMLVEPSGAVAAASVMFKKVPAGLRRIGVIVSGGNVDLDFLKTLGD